MLLFLVLILFYNNLKKIEKFFFNICIKDFLLNISNK
jgi:hypothetical protein